MRAKCQQQMANVFSNEAVDFTRMRKGRLGEEKEEEEEWEGF